MRELSPVRCSHTEEVSGPQGDCTPIPARPRAGAPGGSELVHSGWKRLLTRGLSHLQTSQLGGWNSHRSGALGSLPSTAADFQALRFVF